MSVSCILTGDVSGLGAIFTIRSILKHGGENCELILVLPTPMYERGRALATEFGNDLRVVLLDSKDEGPVDVANQRALGLSVSSNDYIAFFKPGDWIDADYFNLYLANAIQNKAAFAMAPFKRYELQTHAVTKQAICEPNRPFELGNLSSACALSMNSDPSAKFFRRDVLLEILKSGDDNLEALNDFALHWLACSLVNAVQVSPVSGYSSAILSRETGITRIEDKLVELRQICSGLSISNNPYFWGLFQELLIRRAEQLRNEDPNEARERFTEFAALVDRIPLEGLSEVTLSRSNWTTALSYLALKKNKSDRFLNAEEAVVSSSKIALACEVISELGIRQFLTIWGGNREWVRRIFFLRSQKTHVWIN